MYKYNIQALNENDLNIDLHFGIYTNDLKKLFQMNSSRNDSKLIFEIQSENELMEYISNSTFYGSYIEATNVNKILKLGLDRPQLTLILKRWLIKMFSIECL